MHQIFQPFSFTGSQVAGGEMYIALWGGAGSANFRSTTTKWGNLNVASGSGGLVLAKITGVDSSQNFKIYVGGRGSVGQPRHISASLFGAAAAPRTTAARSDAYRAGGQAGAASALTIQVGSGAEEFLLIAPSGGGQGGLASSAQIGNTPANSLGGQGTFAANLGRSAVTAGANANGSSSKLFEAPGNLGFDPTGSLAASLLGGAGEIYQGAGRRRSGRGGGGAPNGAAGAAAASRSAAEGGAGGQGFIYGGPAVGASQTIYTTFYTSGGSNIKIEAIGFDGRVPLGPSANGNRGLIDDLKSWYANQAHATGAFVREVTNALGWDAAVSGAQVEWPPALNSRSANVLNSLSISDPAALTRRPMRTFPGQASQRAKDNGTAIPGNYQTTAHPGVTNWHSNGGAAMLRFGSEGACFGFEARDYRGGYSDVLTSNSTATRWLPTNDSNEMSSIGGVTSAADALTATFGAAYGGDSNANAVATTFSFNDDLTSHLSATTNTQITDLNLGPIHPGTTIDGIGSYFYQIRDASADVYVVDLADSTPSLSTTTDITGVETSAGARKALAVHPMFGAIYDNATTTFAISDDDASPTATARGTSGAAALNTPRQNAIDQYGFGYIADNGRSIDVFNVADSANSHPVVLAQSSVVPGSITGLTYDFEHDILWSSQSDGSSGTVSPIAIVRNAEFEPILLQDLDVGSSTQAARTLGDTGDNAKIFFAKSGTLIQQGYNNLRLLDVSSALPNPAFIHSTDAAGLGAYVSLSANGDALNCNLTTGFAANGMSVVLVVRPSGGLNTAFMYFDSGSASSSQCYGPSTSNDRVGMFEADLYPARGNAWGASYANEWVMVSATWAGSRYVDHDVIGVNGNTSDISGSNGSNAASDIDDISNFGIYLGSPDASFAGNNNFDIAFARIYQSQLTASQTTQIWDHWAERNGALFTANGQSAPSFTSGRADVLTALHAEWDFAKMPANSLQTTQGNAGSVAASLVGSASFVSLTRFAVNGVEAAVALDFKSNQYRTANAATTFAAAFIGNSPNLTYSTSSNSTMVNSSGNIVWAPHNLALNSAAPATQTVSVTSGADYTVEVTGTGSMALTGAGTGTATDGSPVTITASTTSLTVTLTGSLDTLAVYRSDLGGMAPIPGAASGFETYVPTTGNAEYLPRVGHHVYDGAAWVNEGLLIESEARTNLLLNTAALSTQSVTVTAAAHTLSFTGTGTVTLSGASTGGPLIGTGTGEDNRVDLTFTPTAGTLTLTVSGTVSNAQLEAASTPSSYIPTSGASATRAAQTLAIPPAAFSWNNSAVSIQMDGRMTFADQDQAMQHVFWRWKKDNFDQIRINLDTHSSYGTGRISFQQIESNTYDLVNSSANILSPGSLAPLSIASRHGTSFVNGAVDGTALTANTTPAALPDLSSTNLEIAPDYMGTVATFRQFGGDIRNTGLQKATS